MADVQTQPQRCLTSVAPINIQVKKYQKCKKFNGALIGYNFGPLGRPLYEMTKSSGQRIWFNIITFIS